MGLLDKDVWAGKVFTGSWVDTGATMQSTEPATGDVLGEVGTASADELSRSAAAASEAGRAWAAADYRERAAVLRRAAELFAEHRDEITTWLVREAGKARGAAQLDMDLALDELREAAALPSNAWGALLPTTQPGGSASPGASLTGWWP
ncbi:acyl-CoA reductase-like NAD-dependent aldehyde dehydrogenase [Actinophytocola algeriensis]|uniref:Acyl-CoA reductase-like NAD-dependent aldehyde dehydrogenase n=1 Tax=Actinophytocola algeriensis TaxID=1768010 RepID=A0A7W7QFQ2_9PSEU|nr:acyl-CoA reductase-like NAD-dependent aldehyde dehydrogenase [Actinophytocola algeriensis]MBE1473587.1 acyl-CoA reductase-like NAD-dependent aldehyde dehydrogenase [Actinophytocola algeriensis]